MVELSGRQQFKEMENVVHFHGDFPCFVVILRRHRAKQHTCFLCAAICLLVGITPIALLFSLVSINSFFAKAPIALLKIESHSIMEEITQEAERGVVTDLLLLFRNVLISSIMVLALLILGEFTFNLFIKPNFIPKPIFNNSSS